jgi:hypothetical protein
MISAGRGGVNIPEAGERGRSLGEGERIFARFGAERINETGKMILLR